MSAHELEPEKVEESKIIPEEEKKEITLDVGIASVHEQEPPVVTVSWQDIMMD